MGFNSGFKGLKISYRHTTNFLFRTLPAMQVGGWERLQNVFISVLTSINWNGLADWTTQVIWRKTQTNASNQTLLNQHKMGTKINFPLSNRGVLTWELRGRVRGISQTKYSYAPHNDVSVNDGPHIRRWSHNIIILTTVLQLPTVFSTVTCCTGL